MRVILLIDYVQVSIDAVEISDLIEWLFAGVLNPSDFFEMRSHVRGFSKVLSNGTVFFHFDNEGQKPIVLLEIKSSGCRALESNISWTWSLFFQKLTRLGELFPQVTYRIKRIDIAIDTFTEDLLTTSRVQWYQNKKLVTSRMQTLRIVRSYKVNGNVMTGDSIYFGRRTSDFSIIVYDKKLEAKSENTWYRTEMRLRGSQAFQFVEELLHGPDSVSDFLSKKLKTNLQFRSHLHKRSELRRRDLAAWYVIYLDEIRTQTIKNLY